MSKRQSPMLMGLPVVEVEGLPSPEGTTFGDLSAYIVPIGTIPASTPILEALAVMRDAGVITDTDREALASLPGVRTMGDLRTVLDRGEITGELGERLRRVLG